MGIPIGLILYGTSVSPKLGLPLVKPTLVTGSFHLLYFGSVGHLLVSHI